MSPGIQIAMKMLARENRQVQVVVFDFAGVASIGQAFADDVFRVFAAKHPEIEISTMHLAAEVKKMISLVSTKE
ncbi:MAG: STAS-like domain-containing protein [Sulfuricella sp.]|nr:STAS-like domain-containing protein [Sulfuricella sp.]